MLECSSFVIIVFVIVHSTDDQHAKIRYRIKNHSLIVTGNKTLANRQSCTVTIHSEHPFKCDCCWMHFIPVVLFISYR